jgi:hypothetical protein
MESLGLGCIFAFPFVGFVFVYCIERGAQQEHGNEHGRKLPPDQPVPEFA